MQQVRLHIVEFRGFEKFIQGRPYWEVPVMVQRLCGICPVQPPPRGVARRWTRWSARRTLTPTAEKIRRLMHYGQILQSHALHFFHLSSPDLLFGFDSESRGATSSASPRRTRTSRSRACCCASSGRR